MTYLLILQENQVFKFVVRNIKRFIVLLLWKILITGVKD